MFFPRKNDIYIDKYIRSGAFGKIYKGCYNGRECIVKNIPKKAYRFIEHEITSQTKNKDNLLSSYHKFENDEISLIFPFYKNGDFFDYISDKLPLHEDELKKYTYQFIVMREKQSEQHPHKH